MKEKFDPKTYQGKDRIYTPVGSSPGISRLWHWNASLMRYDVPAGAKPFVATKYAQPPSKKRLKQFFNTLDDARSWQRGVEDRANSECLLLVQGPRFEELVDTFKRQRFPALSDSTRGQYEKLLRLYFEPLMQMQVEAIRPAQVDQWIGWLKELAAEGHSTRIAFRHELKLLSVLLRYYIENSDETTYVLPIKRRHREAIVVKPKGFLDEKDLTELEFEQFSRALLEGAHGTTMSAMATVQYYQALRVSEVAALHWSDVVLNRSHPELSRLRTRRSVFWPRRKGMRPQLRIGFKNSKTSPGGVKEQPLFPLSYSALAGMPRPKGDGLVFNIDGELIDYRQVQYAYDSAFKRIKLTYKSTHILRHGGTRRVYNQCSDTEVAKQLLGNSDLQTALIYAQRDKGALTEVAKREWLQLVADKQAIQKAD